MFVLIKFQDVTHVSICKNFLLLRDYTQHEVKEAMERMGGLLPMNIFLRQEIGRMQKVCLAQ